MAVPTITAVTPAIGITRGGNLVEITGTGFRQWSIPAFSSSGPSGDERPTVAVYFGGSASPQVGVVDGTRVLAIAPYTPLPLTRAAGYGEGLVDVVVKNLDDDGNPIAGELATAANAYRYSRVQLAKKSDLKRVCEALILKLRVEVIPTANYTPHTDNPDAADLASPTPKNEVAIASVPGLTLLGPHLDENRFYSLNQQPTTIEGGEVVTRRVPSTQDLTFTIVGVSDHRGEFVNLMALTQKFFEANKYLRMQRDPNDVSKGFVDYEMAIVKGGDMKPDDLPSNSNVKSFSGRFVVRGFDIEDHPGFDDQVIQRSKTVDTTTVTSGGFDVIEEEI